MTKLEEMLLTAKSEIDACSSHTELNDKKALPILEKIYNHYLEYLNMLITEAELYDKVLACGIFLITEKSELVEIFDNILEQCDNEISEKFIFFEESFNNDGLVTNDAELIDILWETLDKKDFILKHHPRNSTDRFKELLPTVDFPMFWEHYFLKHNIENKVIVTVSSNTAFVPYIIAKIKPTVVLLYKLFNGTSPVFP